VDIGTAHVTAGVRWGALTLRGGVAAHSMQMRVAGAGDDDLHFGSWHWSARWQQPDALGNRWSLRAGGRGVDGPAPVQHRVWLGDWQPGETSGELAAAGALSGWPAGTLLGDRGLWGSLAVDLNVDPWRALRVPGLGKMGLRPLVFVEWGGVWGEAVHGLEFGAPGAGFMAPVTGWRADAGFGFSRRLDLPLGGGGESVRGAGGAGGGPGRRGAGLAGGGGDWEGRGWLQVSGNWRRTGVPAWGRSLKRRTSYSVVVRLGGSVPAILHPTG
jgi:hypothetical protein